MKSTIVYLILFIPWDISCQKGNFQWWRGTEIYDIYVPSYMDSNNDGIGDINGLTSKLPYLKDLGIEVIKLSTIFETAEKHSFHFEGVTNYKKIDPLLGSIKDFENFMKKAESKGIKVILDLPINYCHESHKWFQNSRRSIKPYKYYFVWKHGNTSVIPPKPPNQILTHDENYRTSAWTFDNHRRKFYYHWYHNSLPNLNVGSKMLKKEMKNIMNFWLDKGVAGFHLLTLQNLAEALKSESVIDDSLIKDEPTFLSFLHDMKKNIDKYSEIYPDFERIITIEPNQKENSTRYFTDKGVPLAHIISKKKFIESINILITSDELDALLNPNIKLIEQNQFLEWISESTTTERLVSRLDNNKPFSELIFFILAMLPGIMRIFYGQEIGMSEPLYRDRYTPYTLPWISHHPLPMHWSDSANAGFTSNNEPYLKLNPNYWEVNVEQQQREFHSLFHMIKDLLEIRRKATLIHGDFKSYTISKYIYAFKRSFHNHETYLTIVNLSNEHQMIVGLHSIFEIPSKISKVVAATANSAQQKGYTFDEISSLILRPLSGVVITYRN